MDEKKQLDQLLNKLRAAVLGANDGIVSVAGVIIGVAAAGSEKSVIAIAGIAALASGAVSMAGGEYVSVAAQRDAEHGHGREKHEVVASPIAAALASFFAFLAGGLLPLASMLLSGDTGMGMIYTAGSVVLALVLTGFFAAKAGRSSVLTGMRRNVAVSVLTIGISYSVGMLLGFS